MAQTTPKGEQIQFVSSKTGTHNLDTYLEAAEIGNRQLHDLLDDMFDSSTGAFKADNFQFQFDNATNKIQVRVGQYAGPNTGWTDITPFFKPRGQWVSGTNYFNFDLVTVANNDVYLVHGAYPTGVTFVSGDGSDTVFTSSVYTTKLVDVSGAEDWATKTGSAVSGTDFSAKEHAVGTAVTTGSAKDWATKIGTPVSGTAYSAKYNANAADQHRATALQAQVIAADHKSDAQKLAIEPHNSPITLADGVTTGYSALHYNTEASAHDVSAGNSATAANSSAVSASASKDTATNAKNDAVKLALEPLNSIFTLNDGTQGKSALHYATVAQTLYDNFNSTYHGASQNPPSTNVNTGDLFFSTNPNAAIGNALYVKTDTAWVKTSPQYSSNRTVHNHTSGSTHIETVAGTAGFIDVYLNGVKLAPADFNETSVSGGIMVSVSGLNAGDIIEYIAWETFQVGGLGTASALNVGIASDNIAQFDANIADDDFLRINGTKVEGLSATQMASELPFLQATVTSNVASIDSSYTGGFRADTKIGVGIDPTYAIHTSGASAADSSIYLKRTDAGTTNPPVLYYEANAGANDDADLGGIWFQTSVDNNAYAIIKAKTDEVTGTSGKLEFITGTSALTNTTDPKMVLDSNGHLGIGIDNIISNNNRPRYELDVISDGTGVLGLQSTLGSAHIRLRNSNSTSTSTGLISFADTGGDAKIRFAHNVSENGVGAYAFSIGSQIDFHNGVTEDVFNTTIANTSTYTLEPGTANSFSVDLSGGNASNIISFRINQIATRIGSNAYYFILKKIMGSTVYNFQWTGSASHADEVTVKWIGGSAPVQAANTTDIYGFYIPGTGGGATVADRIVYGFIMGQDIA